MRGLLLNKYTALKRSAVFKSSFWALLGFSLGKGLTLLGGICVANIIGKELYGEYGLLKSTLMSMATFSTLGLGYTATRFVALIASDEKRRGDLNALISILLRIALVFSSIVALLVLIFASDIALLLEDPSLTLVLRLLSGVIVLNALSTTQVGILAGLSMFREMARVDAVVGLVTFLMTIALSLLWGFHGAVFALACSYLLTCILYRTLLRRRRGETCRQVSEQRYTPKELLLFSLPIALQELVYTIFNWLSILILLKLSNYGEVAVYSASSQWSNVLLFIPGALRGVTLSHLSQASSEEEKAKKIFRAMILTNVICTSSVTIFLFLFRGPLEALYPADFVGLHVPLLVLSSAMIVASVYNVFVSYLVSSGRTWAIFYVMCIREVSRVLLMYLVIEYYKYGGAFGASVAMLIAQILGLFVVVLAYCRRYKNDASNAAISS